MIRKLSAVLAAAAIPALLVASPASAKREHGPHCRHGSHARHGMCVRSDAHRKGGGHGRGTTRLESQLTPLMQGDMALRGVAPGLPWVLRSGEARISGRGRSVTLDVQVKGFLFDAGTPYAGTIGPVTRIFATVTGENGKAVSTRSVRLSPRGNAHIHQRVRLPRRMLAPIVLVRVPKSVIPTENWIAATGLS